MKHFSNEVPAVIFAVLLLSVSVSLAQPALQELQPNKPITFSLSPEEGRMFPLNMKEDDFAEITWPANDKVNLLFGFIDKNGKVIHAGNSSESGAAVFIAPKSGLYQFIIKLEPSPDVTGPQNVSLEYKNIFKLPPRSKQMAIRRVNGFDVKIFYAPSTDPDFGESIVTIEKGGKLKKVICDDGNPTYIGFSFPGKLNDAKSVVEKRRASLIQNTIDKTGDGIPDVMIEYFSGGAHCCSSMYFINLGSFPEIVEVIDTEHAGLAAIGKNPRGGLRFETNENAFAYWNMSFAGSPMPRVMLEFEDGKLKPNFLLMRKPPPSLAKLKSKARAARLRINSNPYTEVGMDFEEAFWDQMLDLIYTGHEDLAWQYFDLVWPAGKPGKNKFLADFNEQLAESYYGTKSINTSNSLRNFIHLLERNLRNQQ
jgi:hypothetical protein